MTADSLFIVQRVVIRESGDEVQGGPVFADPFLGEGYSSDQSVYVKSFTGEGAVSRRNDLCGSVPVGAAERVPDDDVLPTHEMGGGIQAFRHGIPGSVAVKRNGGGGNRLEQGFFDIAFAACQAVRDQVHKQGLAALASAGMSGRWWILRYRIKNRARKRGIDRQPESSCHRCCPRRSSPEGRNADHECRAEIQLIRNTALYEQVVRVPHIRVEFAIGDFAHDLRDSNRRGLCGFVAQSKSRLHIQQHFAVLQKSPAVWLLPQETGSPERSGIGFRIAIQAGHEVAAEYRMRKRFGRIPVTVDQAGADSAGCR